ncbi:MAG: LamG domain-containing protein [Deltaproteobacteria bacterium]|nr:LamG domain-containing protein [Deltaproteobacteria bacterium]
MDRSSLVIAGLALGLAAACGSSTVFECGADGDCLVSGIDGVCQASGYCSFPDNECESGQQYGDLSPSGLAGTCVPVAGTGTTAGTSSGGAGSSSGSVQPDGSGSSSDDGPVTTSGGDSTTGVETTTGGVPVDPDLVVWLPLDTFQGGETPDLSGNDNHALCGMGCPEVVPGVVGMAGSFDRRTETLLAIPTSPMFAAELFTVAVWIRPHRLAGSPMTIAELPLDTTPAWNSWELRLDGLDPNDLMAPHRLFFAIATVDAQTVVQIPDVPFGVDDWVHLAGVWNGMTLELYIDGDLIGLAPPGAVEFSGDFVIIGAGLVDGMSIDDWFEGDLDDFRLYSRALTGPELEQLANPVP